MGREGGRVWRASEKQPGRGVPSLVGQRRKFGEGQGICLLNFGGRGDGWDFCSTRYAASSLNLPFENAKCVYPVNNLRKNIHLKEDIH